MTGAPAVARRVIGGVYLVCAGVNAGLVLGDAATYREFAASSYLPVVRRAWASVVMAHPVVWILLLTVGEIAIGAMLLNGRRSLVRLGWIGVIGFHLLLMLFGLGFWLWCLPVLAVVVPLARRDLRTGPRTQGPRAGPRASPTTGGDASCASPPSS